MSTNRQYKDTVFVKLFSDKEKLIELYNAIEGANYPSDTEVEIITLENVLYYGKNNDLGFLINKSRIVIIEHQSTINLNAPLRTLIYLPREYEKIIDNKSIYKKKRMEIPTPTLVVLYNGKDNIPKESMLRLSDAFIEKPKGFVLDVEVKVININYDPDSKILAASPTLKEYAQFMAKIRAYGEAGMTRDEAITKSVKECIEAGILKDFLKKNSSEVFNMLFTEFNMEDALQVCREEAMEDGMAEGKAEIIAAVKKMLKKGLVVYDIADMLDLEVNYVQKVIDLINEYLDSSNISIAAKLIEQTSNIYA